MPAWRRARRDAARRRSQDRFNYDRAYLEASIDVALGGRVAEEIAFPEVTTGAEDDIRRVTALARNMVGRWGQSAMRSSADRGTGAGGHGLAARHHRPRDAPAGGRRGPRDGRACARWRVTELLRTHEDALHRLADALLLAETLDDDEAAAAAGLQPSGLTSRSHSMEGTA